MKIGEISKSESVHSASETVVRHLRDISDTPQTHLREILSTFLLLGGKIMAVKATVNVHKVRVEESLKSVLTRIMKFQGAYSKEFEEFIKRDDIKRALKTISSYLS